MMKNRLFAWIVLTMAIVPLWAEDVTFTASAPSSVIMDKPFQVVYTVNASAKDLRVPEWVDFDVLAGPFESRSSSTQWMNGKRTSSMSHTFTYTLMAKKEGTFTLSPASVMVKGDKYVSNGLKIKVRPPDNNSTNSSGASAQQESTAPEVSNENIFIRTIVSKTKVYEQECIVLSYKLYTLVDVRQFTGSKLPDFTGFLKQDIDLGDNNQLEYEHYNGRNYASAVLAQMLLYPQHDGEIVIEPATFDAVIRVQNRSQVRSIFDDFFDSYSNVTKTLKAPGVKINVKPLPTGKPSSFSGVVGDFTLQSSISATEVDVNDAITLKLSIAGTGNMKLIKSPNVEFPAGLEVYDPKVNNQFATTKSGMSGTKTMEYLIIPRASGTYQIPSLEWSYFDAKQGEYRRLQTQPYTIIVRKGEQDSVTTTLPTYVSKENIQQLSTDIRFIYTGPLMLQQESDMMYGGWNFVLAYIIPLLLGVVLFVVFRKQIRLNADEVRVKNKRANKMAQKRLRVAQRYMKEQRKDLFYDEVLRALWSYLSDKLAIPTSHLTRDNVSVELERHAVDADLIAHVLHVIELCEYARYAPVMGDNPMGELYAETVQLISDLDGKIK